jgi:hypothetical protein
MRPVVAAAPQARRKTKKVISIPLVEASCLALQNHVSSIKEEDAQ